MNSQLSMSINNVMETQVQKRLSLLDKVILVSQRVEVA